MNVSSTLPLPESLTPPVQQLSMGVGYDSNSTVQRADMYLAQDTLEHMAATAPASGDPMWIADYGCGPGGSSQQLTRQLASCVRKRQPHRHLVICRNDRPENDWNNCSRHSGNGSHERVTEMFAPGSFDKKIFPNESICLGTCFAALHWLPYPPLISVDNHITAEAADGINYSISAGAFQQHFLAFLTAREAELEAGGSLALSIVASDPDDSTVHGPFDVLGMSARKMVEGGLIPQRALRDFHLPIHRPTPNEVTALFEDGNFGRLRIEFLQVTHPPCPHWVAFENHGDSERYAKDYTGFVQGFSETSISTGLLAGNMSLTRAFYDIVEDLSRQDPAAYALKQTRINMLLRKR